MTHVLVAAFPSPRRQTLETELRGHGWQVTAVSSGDLDALVRQAVHDDVDVLLVDPGVFPERGDVFHQLARRVPDMPALVLVLADDEAGFVDAVAGGAMGGVVSERPHDADRALRAAMERRPAVPRRFEAGLVSALRFAEASRTGSDGLERLTARERDILGLLARGHSTREVADILVVEPVTVRTHVAAAVRKLGVSDRAAAVDVARSALS